MGDSPFDTGSPAQLGEVELEAEGRVGGQQVNTEEWNTISTLHMCLLYQSRAPFPIISLA